MAINKKTREAVYRKYGGRCAYCGRAIAYKDMQVDHFRPLRVWDEVDGAADDISNLMPACRMCNHYKRANSLEVFRRYIAEIPRKLRDNYIYKIGVAYMHISTGCVYQMPNDQRALVLARGMSDERPDKFAGNGKKPVRRGGS